MSHKLCNTAVLVLSHHSVATRVELVLRQLAFQEGLRDRNEGGQTRIIRILTERGMKGVVWQRCFSNIVFEQNNNNKRRETSNRTRPMNRPSTVLRIVQPKRFHRHLHQLLVLLGGVVILDEQDMDGAAVFPPSNPQTQPVGRPMPLPFDLLRLQADLFFQLVFLVGELRNLNQVATAIHCKRVRKRTPIADLDLQAPFLVFRLALPPMGILKHCPHSTS